jgi:hypothetical protein
MAHLIRYFLLIFHFYYVWWGSQKLFLSTAHVLIANTNGKGRRGGFAREEEQCCQSLWMSQRTHVEAFVGVNNNMGWCHDTLCMPQASRMSISTCTISLVGWHQSFIEHVLRSLQLQQSPHISSRQVRHECWWCVLELALNNWWRNLLWTEDALANGYKLDNYHIQ